MPSVLIVEDQPENQYLLQALLGGYGYAMRAASYLREQAGRQFDPAIVAAFLTLLEQPVADEQGGKGPQGRPGA